jgi:nucleoid-associated protein EbfC
MQFRGGINELMRQAARMQRRVEDAKAAVKDKEVVGLAIGDKVKATVTLGKKLSRVEIDAEFLKAEAIDLVLDGVCAAVNAGFDEAEKAMQAEVDKVTGGVKIPGLT